MADGFFFNGRMWFTPSTMSVINDSAMADQSLTVGNVLCLIGPSAGGKPLTPLIFSSPSDALAMLVSGSLCDATVRAFAPSPDTNAPASVMAVRVGQAMQATLTLLDSNSNPVIDLTTDQYGLSANSTTIKIGNGTSSGKKITVGNGTTYAVADNVGRNAFTIQYAGAQASATMTISNTQVILNAPSGNPVSTLDLASYPTVGQLVNAINAVTGFSATQADGQSGNSVSLNGLDTVSSPADVRTSLYTATANLQAVVDFFNSANDQFVTAVRHDGTAGAPPVNIGTTYMSGGTSPAPITGDWTNALTMLQTQDVQWIVPLTGDASIQAATDAHCQFMSSVGRKERRWLSGPAVGTSKTAVAALPFPLNSDRGSICYPGYYAFNSAGVLTLYDSFMTAALIAAGFAGMNPGDSMTNKVLTVQGLEVALADPSDTDTLIQAGVLAVKQTPEGYKVVRAISTWLSNNNYNRVEVSCGAAVDFTVHNVRKALDPLKGGRNDPLQIGRAIVYTETALADLSIPEPQGPGTLVGDTNSPPYKNITASVTGDVLAVSFQCSPVIPTNFIPITVAIVPFAGSATSTSGTTIGLAA